MKGDQQLRKDLEEEIVKAFFEKQVQERVLHELFSPKKRDQALNRLCHQYEKMLRGKYMTEILPPNSNPKDIYELLKKEGAKNSVYSLSYNEKIDGKELPLLEALKQAVGFGMPSLISCIPGELAYFEAEQGFGPPPRFLLRRPKLERFSALENKKQKQWFKSVHFLHPLFKIAIKRSLNPFE